jgi:hypothetical protein
MKNHYERILNFFEKRHTDAAEYSYNANLKQFMKTFREITDMKFLFEKHL